MFERDPFPNKTGKCIICWIAETNFCPEEAAGYILGEAIKYPYAVESRFHNLCDKHAKVSVKQGNKSPG
jgi:hypothetical protein